MLAYYHFENDGDRGKLKTVTYSELMVCVFLLSTGGICHLY